MHAFISNLHTLVLHGVKGRQKVALDDTEEGIL